MLTALLISVVAGVLVRFRVPSRVCTDHRLGLLGGPVRSPAEAVRAARLRQLGEAGTRSVHNCGRILSVDYDRGEFVVQRRAARRQQPGMADVYRVHNCGKILHVDYSRGELIVEREPS